MFSWGGDAALRSEAAEACGRWPVLLVSEAAGGPEAPGETQPGSAKASALPTVAGTAPAAGLALGSFRVKVRWGILRFLHAQPALPVREQVRRGLARREAATGASPGFCAFCKQAGRVLAAVCSRSALRLLSAGTPAAGCLLPGRGILPGRQALPLGLGSNSTSSRKLCRLG